MARKGFTDASGGGQHFQILPTFLSPAISICRQIRNFVNAGYEIQAFALSFTVGFLSEPRHGRAADDARRAADTRKHLSLTRCKHTSPQNQKSSLGRHPPDRFQAGDTSTKHQLYAGSLQRGTVHGILPE